MKFAISTLCLYEQPGASVSRLIRDNPSVKNWEIMDDGYHCLDRRLVKELRPLRAEGVNFTVHAPFSSINISEHQPSLRNVFIKTVEKSIYQAAEIGATIEVVHAATPTIFSYFFPEDSSRTCGESLAKLMDYGHSVGVEVVVENGVGPYDLFNTVEKISGILATIPRAPTCLDLGHAHVTGPVAGFITGQPRIRHIHLHDNHGQHDEHLAAGEGTIDWKEVCRLLKQADYRGLIVTENHNIQLAFRSLNYLQSVLRDS